MKKYLAEMIGTMVLVLMGCGSAVFAGTVQPFSSVGTLGVAFAFGLAVLTMVYTIGKISGCRRTGIFSQNKQDRRADDRSDHLEYHIHSRIFS